MKNYTFEQKQLLKEHRRKRKERRNKRILSIIAFIVISSLLITPLYIKANQPRECAIHSIEGNTIIVRHPNDKLYSFTTDRPEQFEEDTMITVVFDELTDWEDYIAKGVK